MNDSFKNWLKTMMQKVSSLFRKSERLIGEYAKESSENMKDSSEIMKDSSETVKGSSETVNGSSESVKDSSESAKDSLESVKDSSESAKDSLETVKGSSESMKDSSETVKDSSESAKGSSESMKDSSESMKDSLEIVKGSSESMKDSSEIVKDSSGNMKDSSETMKDSSQSENDSSESGKDSTMKEKDEFKQALKMKKRNIIIGLVLIAVVAIAVFYYIKSKKPQPVTFVTTTLMRGDVSKSITATGTMQPVDTVSVGAQVSGVIQHIYIDFNDVVKKGQLIAKIDPALFESQVKAAQANLINSKSNLQYQQTTYDRQSKLFKLGAISKADFQLALNQRDVNKAAVDNANALLSIAKRNLFYTDIYSPIDGIVLNRAVAEGQTIAASFNAPVLFVIAKDLTKMQVRAAVDEADIGDVRAGQKVSFTVDAFPDEYFKGIVQEIQLHPKTSANVITYPTLINVDNTSMKLKPGMTANIYIFTEEVKNAMMIPLKALTFKPDSTLLKSYVFKDQNDFENKKSNHYQKKSSPVNSENASAPKSFVWIKKGDTLIRKRILIGINDDSNVEVMKGLSKNDQVILNVIAEAPTDDNNAQQSPFVPKFNQKPTKPTR